MDFILSSENKGQNPVFICPNCHLKTAHSIKHNIIFEKIADSGVIKEQTTIFTATCLSCEEVSYILQHSTCYGYDYRPKDSFPPNELSWKNPLRGITPPALSGKVPSTDLEVINSQKIVEPEIFNNVPNPNSDLSNDTKKLYYEAAKVLNVSPRASVALLRVALETFLRVDLMLQGKNNYEILGKLYGEGIPEELDSALHFARIAGNSADHIDPGKIQLDGTDGVNTAIILFKIINLVAEEKISRKKELLGLKQFMSQKQLDGIEKLHEINE